jgi:hypothetical protein
MPSPFQAFFYLLAYLAVLYVRPHDYVPWLIGVPILPILLFLGTVFWMARQTKNMAAPQFKLLIVQLFLMSWSVLVTGWLSGAITVISDFYPVVLLFYMVATSVDSVQRLRQMFVLLSSVMFIIALHSIDQAENGIGWTGAEMINERVAYLGFLNDPNDLSMAFLMVLPMVIYMARRASWKLVRLFWWGVVFAFLYSIKLANSRGAVLSLAAMTLQFGIFRFGLMRSLLAAPVMLLPIIVFGPSRMDEMSSDEESAEGRIDAWYEGFQMLIHHPLFGVGKGMFVDHHYLTAHNSYVLAVAELGVCGYTIWISNIALTILMARKVQTAGVPQPVVVPKDGPQSKAPEPVVEVESWPEVHEGMRTLWYGLVGGLVSMFFLSRSYVTILYVHIALIVAMYQLARTYRPDIEELTFSDRWGRLVTFAFGSVIVLWLVTMILLRTK